MFLYGMNLMSSGLAHVKDAVNETDPDKFEEFREKLVKYEEISDRIEYENKQYA